MVSCLISDQFSHGQSYVCSHAKYKHNSFTETSLEGGVAVLGCQLDHLELTKTQGSGYTCEGFSLNGSFEVGFKVERPSLSLNQLSGASPHRDVEEGSSWFSPVCSCSYWQVHSFTEEQLGHPASWTKELDSWTSHQETAIVGTVGPQPVSNFNKHTHLSSIRYFVSPFQSQRIKYGVVGKQEPEAADHMATTIGKRG